MNYQVIFTSGYTDDYESLMKHLKCDVLLLDEKNNYYELHFITLERIKSEFTKNKTCFLEENMIILHEVTRDNILKSIVELHRWKFSHYWRPLTLEQVQKYYYPRDKWTNFTIIIDSEGNT